MVLALNSDDILDIDLDRLAQCAQHTVCVAHPRLPFGRVSEIDGFATFEESRFAGLGECRVVRF